MRILTENLKIALATAIKAQTEAGNGESALVQGWKQALDAIEKNEPITVSDYWF